MHTILRARRRHVEKAHFVLRAPRGHTLAEEGAQNRVVGGEILFVVRKGCKAPLFVGQNFFLEIPVVEPIVHARHDDDGKFKPLGGVHGHHPHGVFAARLGKADLITVIFQAAQDVGHAQRAAFG